MTLHLYQCSFCHTIDVRPNHHCPAMGRDITASTVIRYCSICHAQLEAGKMFHDWCARIHRAELAAQREEVEARCRKTGDSIDDLIDCIPDIAPWQRTILRQLVEQHRAGEPVKLAANSKRAGKMTLKRHWERIEKIMKSEEK